MCKKAVARGIWFLYIPTVVAMLVDIGFTVYYNWGYILHRTGFMNETSPVGRFVLQQQPLVALAMVCAYFALVWAGLRVFSHRWRLVFFFGVMFGHGAEGHHWLVLHLGRVLYSQTLLWTVCICAAVVFGALCALMVRHYFRCVNGRNDAS